MRKQVWIGIVLMLSLGVSANSTTTTVMNQKFNFGDLFIDVESFPHNGYGIVQTLTLIAGYGAILFYASNLISDGSELLLLIPSIAPLVVLFSGLTGSHDAAQQKLGVGVGALAGSTIMLLTLPTILAIFAGSVDIENGVALYKRPSGIPKLRSDPTFTTAGVGLSERVKTAAAIMAVTMIPLIIIQIPSYFFSGMQTASPLPTPSGTATNPNAAIQERPYALIGLIIAVLMFVVYLAYQFKQSSSSQQVEDLIDKKIQSVLMDGRMSLSAVFAEHIKELHEESQYQDKLLGDSDISHLSQERFEGILKIFFRKYDLNGDGVIDRQELKYLLMDLGEKISDSTFDEIFLQIDENHDGDIDFPEFCKLCQLLVKFEASTDKEGSISYSINENKQEEIIPVINSLKIQDEEEAEPHEEEEEEEIPEEWRDLPVSVQRWYIKKSAGIQIALGTILVLLFSDPITDCFDSLGERTGIPGFYVSFVLAPFASNASELIAAYNYAARKTQKTITISLETLCGAGIMNNTFCVSIFLALVYIREFDWEFSAETTSIFVTELLIFGIFWFNNVLTRMTSFFIVLCYPLALGLVAFLENVANLN